MILIASTFTGIEISHQIVIVLFGLSRKFGPLENCSGGPIFFMEYWSFAENFGPKADQFSMKKLVRGPIFHEKLVHCRTKIFSLGPISAKILVGGTKIPWKIGPKLKILLKTRANSAKLSAFSDSVIPIYPKNDLKFRAF